MTQRDPDENGWVSSAQGWLSAIGTDGDFARIQILDTPMLARVHDSGAKTLIDIGCGEGRFCRLAQTLGLTTVGIDPVTDFIKAAQSKDPGGTYLCGFAEQLPFEDATFDLAVLYMTLIDIDDVPAAIREAKRVLRPGGRILVANLSSFSTSNGTEGWIKDADSRPIFPMGPYLQERADWVAWDGIRIRNWHRPLSAYMTAFLDVGLTLTYFAEPKPNGGPEDRLQRYEINPFCMMMEWQETA